MIELILRRHTHQSHGKSGTYNEQDHCRNGNVKFWTESKEDEVKERQCEFIQ